MPIAITCGSLVNTRSICPGIRLKTSVPINISPIPPTSEVDSVFLQRSIRSEIIAVCGFHKIIPCENSYFHRGFYARKSYKSMCFYVDFIPPNIILLAPGRIALLEFAIQLSTHYLFVSNFVISQITTNCINIMIPDTPIPHTMPIFP